LLFVASSITEIVLSPELATYTLSPDDLWCQQYSNKWHCSVRRQQPYR
jgi:hypothetical protein